MKTLLQIRSSLYGEAGASSRLTNEYAAAWQARTGGRVVVRDVVADALPHLTAERFAAFTTPATARTPQQSAAVANSDALIAELKAADEIVLGLPMYNFGIPSQLKAYFDHVARAGETFRYASTGAVGLVGEKRVTVFATRGGHYAERGNDHEAAHVRQFFALLGLRDVRFVHVEGLARGDDAHAAAMAQARTWIAEEIAVAQRGLETVS
jgi:FMN-dependent NADH-azoreductase